MTDTDTLLPCPFCGGEASLDENSHGGMWVECIICAGTAYGDHDKATSIAAWNRRTPPTPATDEREAVAVAALINALKQAGGYPATISHLKSGKFSDSISVRIAIAAIMDASAAEILAAEARGYAKAIEDAANEATQLWEYGIPSQEFPRRIRAIEHGVGK